MRYIFAVYLFVHGGFVASATQLISVVHESTHVGNGVRCYFKEEALLVYNPGFIARCNAPRSFKKKLFFCASGTIARDCLKKKQTEINNGYILSFDVVAVPVPGLLIMCAYDQEMIEFSWLKDGVNNAYVFYFNQKKKYMEHSLQENLIRYYAFNNYLPKIESMC